MYCMDGWALLGIAARAVLSRIVLTMERQSYVSITIGCEHINYNECVQCTLD